METTKQILKQIDSIAKSHKDKEHFCKEHNFELESKLHSTIYDKLRNISFALEDAIEVDSKKNDSVLHQEIASLKNVIQSHQEVNKSLVDRCNKNEAEKRDIIDVTWGWVFENESIPSNDVQNKILQKVYDNQAKEGQQG